MYFVLVRFWNALRCWPNRKQCQSDSLAYRYAVNVRVLCVLHLYYAYLGNHDSSTSMIIYDAAAMPAKNAFFFLQQMKSMRNQVTDRIMYLDNTFSHNHRVKMQEKRCEKSGAVARIMLRYPISKYFTLSVIMFVQCSIILILIRIF